MKIKQNIYITDIDEFLAGDFANCLNLYGHDTPLEIAGWIHAGAIELDIDMPREVLAEKAIAELDKAAEKVKADAGAKLEQIAAKRQELLAIEYKGAA